MASGNATYDSFNSNNVDEEEGISGKSMAKDKQALIADGNQKCHEAIPLKETLTYQHETICGFDGLKVIILTSVIFGIAVTIAMVITIVTGKEEVVPHGAVSSDSLECSAIGADIMKAWGSAVDAAIGTMFCIGVLNGHSAGIGGGGFMMVYNDDSRTVFDFQAAAPLASTEDMFQDDSESAQYGAKSIAIPGELMGMQAAYDLFSRKRVSWADLVAPAAQLARGGFKVSTSLADAINATDASKMSEIWRTLYTPNGIPLRAGETLVLSELADTLDEIGNDGPAAYFRGQFANQVVEAISEIGGVITTEDFASYEASTGTPIDVNYGNFTVYSAPAPSGGPGLLSVLNILSGYGFSEQFDASLRYHYTIEAIKFAKAQMLHLGDPAFVDSVQNYTTTMLNLATAEGVRGMINESTTYPSSYYTDYASTLTASGTSHISIIDENTNDLVSITHTLNGAFGSGVMTSGGVILNNIMDEFYWEGKSEATDIASETNNIAPGKRPQCFHCPSLAWNLNDKCAPHMAIGGKSGSNTVDAIAEVLINFISLNYTLDQATNDMVRVYHSLEPNKVIAESGVSSTVIQGLVDRGHEVEVSQSTTLSAVNSVYETFDVLYAETDDREPDSGYIHF